MTHVDPEPQGQRIAQARRRLGLSQAELAALVGRSESWVGQIERGSHSIDKQSLLRVVATALQVTPETIQIEPPAPASERQPNDLDGLRLALTGHPALATAGEGAAATNQADFDLLAVDVDDAWGYVHASRYPEANATLTALIPVLENAAAISGGRAHALLARAYQAAAAAFTRQGEGDAAWVAADRAVAAARQASDPLAVFAGHYRMAHTFSGLQRYDQADRVVETALAALRPLIGSENPDVEALSLHGALSLAGAYSKAREGDRRAARDYVAQAKIVAERLGEDRNDHGTEFGPTNVAVHAVSIAVELGDAGEALEVADGVDVTHMSPERQGRYHLDVARAHAQLGHIDDATESLLAGESVVPDMIYTHPRSRETIGKLLRDAGRRATDRLTQLAKRAGVTA